MVIENIILSEVTRKTNKVYTHTKVAFIHKAKENKTTIHNSREPRQQEGP